MYAKLPKKMLKNHERKKTFQQSCFSIHYDDDNTLNILNAHIQPYKYVHTHTHICV